LDRHSHKEEMMGRPLRVAATLTVLTAVLWSAVLAYAQSPNQVSLPLIAAPPPTPTATVTSPAPSATATATATVTTAPATATATATTTTGPAPFFGDCSSTPPPSAAPNAPVRIVVVNKSASPESVTLQNVSGTPVSLTGWRMCSITGSQEHVGIGGTLAPGSSQTFPHSGGNIWNNSTRDDGALYDASGRLVSYWVDQ
jgi:cytoskeletal protein RodZ